MLNFSRLCGNGHLNPEKFKRGCFHPRYCQFCLLQVQKWLHRRQNPAPPGTRQSSRMISMQTLETRAESKGWSSWQTEANNGDEQNRFSFWPPGHLGAWWFSISDDWTVPDTSWHVETDHLTDRMTPRSTSWLTELFRLVSLFPYYRQRAQNTSRQKLCEGTMVDNDDVHNLYFKFFSIIFLFDWWSSALSIPLASPIRDDEGGSLIWRGIMHHHGIMWQPPLRTPTSLSILFVE